jgi:hypothetical protein
MTHSQRSREDRDSEKPCTYDNRPISGSLGACERVLCKSESMQHIPDCPAPSQPKDRQDSSVSPHLFFLQKRDKKGQVHWRPKTRKRTKLLGDFPTRTKKRYIPKNKLFFGALFLKGQATSSSSQGTHSPVSSACDACDSH